MKVICIISARMLSSWYCPFNRVVRFNKNNNNNNKLATEETKYKIRFIFRKWNNQHVTSVGQRKNLSPDMFTFVSPRIGRPPGVWQVIGSNPIGDSEFFFVPRSWHADCFIFTFVSLSLKFSISHSFIIQYDPDIADPSSMQDACQIWTYHIASLSISSP